MSKVYTIFLFTSEKERAEKKENNEERGKTALMEIVITSPSTKPDPHVHILNDGLAFFLAKNGVRTIAFLADFFPKWNLGKEKRVISG